MCVEMAVENYRAKLLMEEKVVCQVRGKGGPGDKWSWSCIGTWKFIHSKFG